MMIPALGLDTGEDHMFFCTMSLHVQPCASYQPLLSDETKVEWCVLDPNDRNSLHTSAGDIHHHSRYTLKCMKYRHTKAKLISMAYV